MCFQAVTGAMGYTFFIVCALISYTSGLVVYENIVFHKTNEVSSNHPRWLVTFIHDVRPYEVFIDKINTDLDMTHEAMKTLTDRYRPYKFTGYVSTFKSLHDGIGMLNGTNQTVKDNFIDYQSLKSNQRKSKRSLLAIIGQPLSLLFGTVSDVDLENIRRYAEDLDSNQENIIHNLEQSKTILNLSRIEIAENRRAIMDLVQCIRALDDKIK